MMIGMGGSLLLLLVIMIVGMLYNNDWLVRVVVNDCGCGCGNWYVW